MYKRWKDKVIDSRATLPISIALALCGWIATHTLILHSEVSVWLLAIVYAVVGYLLFEFNTNFAFIKAKSPIQISLFILLVISFPQLSASNYQLSTMGMLIAIFFLFRSQQEKQSVGNLFHSFAFLSISSLLQPCHAWLLPLFWLGSNRLFSLNSRSFAASIVGFLMPYWVLWGVCYLQDNLAVCYSRIASIVAFKPFEFALDTTQAIGFGFLLLLLIVAAVNFYSKAFGDKLRTRNYIQFLIILTVILAFGILFQEGLFQQLLPLFIAILSLIVSYFFSMSRGRLANYFFIFVLIGMLSLYLYNNLFAQ